MGRGRILPIGVLAALLYLTSAARPTAAAEGELDVRTVTAYDVGMDGGVHVTITALVTNRDPSTERRSSGRVFFYSATAFAVHDAATNLSARAGGARLMLQAGARDEPLRVVTVEFTQPLYYQDAVTLTLEYDLAAVRAAQLLVGPQYAFVPAIGQGDRSLVRISAPAERQLTVASANCVRTGERPVTYVCGASTVAADYGTGGRCAFTAAAPRWDCAFTGGEFVVIPFESATADLRRSTRSAQVLLARGPVEVRVQHFAGEETWAARVEDLVRRGLPLLEEANGFPYPGPNVIEIVESGYRETHGYEGLASTQGRIHLTPVVDDHTVLHELSHLWSGVFASRWLAEGMADQTANRVAKQLDLRPETVKEPLPSAPRLEEWGPLRSQIAVTRAERDLEEAGYARSLRFVELLAERAGAQHLARANATLAQERQRASARTYLDLLEDLSGVTLAPLFAAWALTDADVQLLPARVAARERAATLSGRAEAARLAVPMQIAEALRAWEFSRATMLITATADALTIHEGTVARARAAGIDLGSAYAAAFARGPEEAARAAEEEAAAFDVASVAVREARARRPLIARAGLLGSEPETRADSVLAALARGEYATAATAATTLQRRLDTAERDGMIRLALTAAAVLVLALFLTLLRHGLRGHQRPTRAVGSRQ